MKAVWNDALLAESDDTVIVEGNHYFPADSLDMQWFEPNVRRKSTCAWKGVASYYDVVVGGQRNPACAWYYADPKPEAEHIRGRIAFWHGVRVEE